MTRALAGRAAIVTAAPRNIGTPVAWSLAQLAPGFMQRLLPRLGADVYQRAARATRRPAATP